MAIRMGLQSSPLVNVGRESQAAVPTHGGGSPAGHHNLLRVSYLHKAREAVSKQDSTCRCTCYPPRAVLPVGTSVVSRPVRGFGCLQQHY